MAGGGRAGGRARQDTHSVSHWLVFEGRLTFVIKSQYYIVLYKTAGLGFILFQIKIGAKDLAQYLEENDKLGQIELYRSGVNKKQKHNQYFTSKS